MLVEPALAHLFCTGENSMSEELNSSCSSISRASRRQKKKKKDEVELPRSWRKTEEKES
jgi:hypothetical protein